MHGFIAAYPLKVGIKPMEYNEVVKGSIFNIGIFSTFTKETLPKVPDSKVA
jgi:hypothetical protein